MRKAKEKVDENGDKSRWQTHNNRKQILPFAWKKVKNNKKYGMRGITIRKMKKMFRKIGMMVNVYFIFRAFFLLLNYFRQNGQMVGKMRNEHQTRT